MTGARVLNLLAEGSLFCLESLFSTLPLLEVATFSISTSILALKDDSDEIQFTSAMQCPLIEASELNWATFSISIPSDMPRAQLQS